MKTAASDRDASDRISAFISSTIAATRAAPSAVAGVAQREQDGWRLMIGTYNAQPTTIYDLASVSKPLTALTSAALVETGFCSWDTPLSSLLSLSQGTFAGEKTLAQLLSHRAGLLAHRKFFSGSWAGSPVRKRQILRWAASSPGPQTPGTALYSDLGYILVGAAIEEMTGLTLEVAIHKHVTLPWRLRIASSGSFRRNQGGERAALDWAPTEMTIQRGGALHGVVHDDNAWALSGFGCSGHAGLFSDARAVLRLGMQLLERLSTAQVAALIQPHASGSLLMGFDGKSVERSAAGSLASPRTFGHLGFTGTSFWVDPERQRATVLLTNRVHPTRDNPRLAPLRSIIHDFLWEC